MATEVTVKKWGNSVGVLLPKEFVEIQGLKEKDKVLIEIVKEANLTKIFGSLKRKMSGQDFKDMVREGWEN
ncbi:MAG: AbrB/MazE/SpoVT family DNA-binding domain-containing protein [Nanoarchaeota archaeon]|nr:AbrB/MazE/SpoVT family DNA-binding domain-containing protein [Nanoarchaeota archaeon]